MVNLELAAVRLFLVLGSWFLVEACYAAVSSLIAHRSSATKWLSHAKTPAAGGGIVNSEFGMVKSSRTQKNPAVGHGRVFKTISIFAFHSSLFSAPASAQQHGAEPEP